MSPRGLPMCGWVLLPQQLFWAPFTCLGKLELVCAHALLLCGQRNVILIFLSMLKVSGSGAFTAKAEFRTLCSILMEKTQITAQLHKHFCSCLHGTC